MRFPIDVLFLDQEGCIVRIDHDVRPWRMRICPGAHAVVELTCGEALRLGLQCRFHSAGIAGQLEETTMKSLLARHSGPVFSLAACSPWAASAQDADRALGPIRLVRPLSPHTIEMLYKEADSAYRGERWTAAIRGFRVLIGYEPGHGRSWFRIGNLHQQRRQYVAAAGAYRRAAAAIDPTAPDVPAGDAVVRNSRRCSIWRWSMRSLPGTR